MRTAWFDARIAVLEFGSFRFKLLLYINNYAKESTIIVFDRLMSFWIPKVYFGLKNLVIGYGADDVQSLSLSSILDNSVCYFKVQYGQIGFGCVF